jgi:hypothetical protein
MMAAQLGQVGGNPGTPQGQGVVSLPLFTVNVTPVNQANVQTVGVQGSTTYYYWAVSQYQIGPSAPVLIAIEANSNPTLSGSNYNQIFPYWTGTTGILTLDLLRTTSNVAPTGACACAVQTGVTPGSTINDQSNSTSGYTVLGAVNLANFTYTLTNEVVKTGIAHALLRQNGVLIDDLVTDTILPGLVVPLSSATSIGSTVLCPVASCGAGTYQVGVYIDLTTACTTTGSYVVNLIYTDDQGSKTVPVNIQGTGATPATGSLVLASLANFGQALQIIRSTGAVSINYSTTAGACGSGGPAIGNIYLTIGRIN